MANLKLAGALQRKIRQGYEVEVYATASDKDDVVAAVLPVTGTVLTLLRQPSFVGELKVVVTDSNGSITDGDLVIVGRGTDGATQTETLDLAGGAATYHTAAEWTYITSITPADITGWGVGDTVSVGTAPAAGEDLDSPVLRDGWWAGLAPIPVGDRSTLGNAPPLAGDWIVRGPENQLVVEFEALVAGVADNAPVVEESADGGDSVTATFADSNNANEHIQTVVTLTSPLYRFRFETNAEQTGKFDASIRARRAP